MKRFFRAAGLALLLLCGAGFSTAVNADVKIKTRSSSGGQTTEQVTYIKGKRQRSENNETSVTITQCDLRRTVELGVPTKTYVVTPFDGNGENLNAAPGQPGQPAKTTVTRRGGLVTTTVTSTDTGERRQMFGYTARRIRTSLVTESSPDACEQNRSRMEQDGWYIDAQFTLDCDYKNGAAAFVPPVRAGGCRDEYRTKQLGAAKTGYPVMVTTTLYDESGKASFSFSQEVLEISKIVLDNALFEAPADYRQVRDRAEMYGAAAMMSAARNQTDTEDDDAATADGAASGVGANAGRLANAARTPASGAAAVVGAKKEGTVRIGVVMTKATAAGEGVNAATLAEAVRNTLMNYLAGPALEVVALEARLPQQIESEAGQKECDYVLYSTVAHKKGGGGGFGGFLKKTAPFAGDVIPLAGAGGTAAGAVATGVAATAIYTAADVAGSVKAKDEVTLEYKLQRGAASIVTKTLKAKAKSDGDDLISQLAEQAASAALAAATVK